MCEEHYLCAEQLNSTDWSKHCMSWKETLNGRIKRDYQVVSQRELTFPFKDILRSSQCFMWEEHHLFKKTMLAARGSRMPFTSEN
jgi:hypothetical protein